MSITPTIPPGKGIPIRERLYEEAEKKKELMREKGFDPEGVGPQPYDPKVLQDHRITSTPLKSGRSLYYPLSKEMPNYISKGGEDNAINYLYKDTFGEDRFNQTSELSPENRLDELNKHFLLLKYKDLDIETKNILSQWTPEALESLAESGYRTPKDILKEIEERKKEFDKYTNESNQGNPFWTDFISAQGIGMGLDDPSSVASAVSLSAPMQKGASDFSLSQITDKLWADNDKKFKQASQLNNNILKRQAQDEGLIQQYDQYLKENKSSAEIEDMLGELSPTYKTNKDKPDNIFHDDYWDSTLDGEPFDAAAKRKLLATYFAILQSKNNDPAEQQMRGYAAQEWISDQLTDIAYNNANWLGETLGKGLSPNLNNNHLVTQTSGNAMLGLNFIADIAKYSWNYWATLAKTGDATEATKYAGERYAAAELGMNDDWSPKKEQDLYYQKLQELKKSADYANASMMEQQAMEEELKQSVHMSFKDDYATGTEYWNKVTQYNTFDVEDMRRIEQEQNGYSEYNYLTNSQGGGTRALILEGQDMAGQIAAQVGLTVATDGALSTASWGAKAIAAARISAQTGRSFGAALRAVQSMGKLGETFKFIDRYAIPFAKVAVANTTVAGGYSGGQFAEALQHNVSNVEAATQKAIIEQLRQEMGTMEAQAEIGEIAENLKYQYIQGLSQRGESSNNIIPPDSYFKEQAEYQWLTNSPRAQELKEEYLNQDSYKQAMNNAIASAGAAAAVDGTIEYGKYAPFMGYIGVSRFGRATQAAMREIRNRTTNYIGRKLFGYGKLGNVTQTASGEFVQGGLRKYIGPWVKVATGITIGGGLSNYTDELASAYVQTWNLNTMRDFMDADIQRLHEQGLDTPTSQYNPSTSNFMLTKGLYDAWQQGVEEGFSGLSYNSGYMASIADRAVQQSSADAFIVGALGSATNFNFNPHAKVLVNTLGKIPYLGKVLYPNNPFVGEKRFNPRTGLYEGYNVKPTTGEVVEGGNGISKIFRGVTSIIGGTDALFANSLARMYSEAKGSENIRKLKLHAFNLAYASKRKDTKDELAILFDLANMEDDTSLFNDDYEYDLGVRVVSFMQHAKEQLGDRNTFFSKFEKNLDDIVEILRKDPAELSEEERTRLDELIKTSTRMKYEVNKMLHDKGIKAPVEKDFSDPLLYEQAQKKYEEQKQQAEQDILDFYKDRLANYGDRKQEIQDATAEIERQYSKYGSEEFLTEEQKETKVYNYLHKKRLESNILDLAKAMGLKINSIEDLYNEKPGPFSVEGNLEKVNKSLADLKKQREELEAQAKEDEAAYKAFDKAVKKGKTSIKLNVRGFKDAEGNEVGETEHWVQAAGEVNAQVLTNLVFNLKNSKMSLAINESQIEAHEARKSFLEEIEQAKKDSPNEKTNTIVQRMLDAATLQDIEAIQESLKDPGKSPYGSQTSMYYNRLQQIWNKLQESEVFGKQDENFRNRKKLGQVKKLLETNKSGNWNDALGKILQYMHTAKLTLQQMNASEELSQDSYIKNGEEIAIQNTLSTWMLAEEYPHIRDRVKAFENTDDVLVYLWNKRYTDTGANSAYMWQTVRQQLLKDAKAGEHAEQLKNYKETYDIHEKVDEKIALLSRAADLNGTPFQYQDVQALRLFFYSLIKNNGVEGDGSSSMSLDDFKKRSATQLYEDYIRLKQGDKLGEQKAVNFFTKAIELKGRINQTIEDNLEQQLIDPFLPEKGEDEIARLALQNALPKTKQEDKKQVKIESQDQPTIVSNADEGEEGALAEEPSGIVIGPPVTHKEDQEEESKEVIPVEESPSEEVLPVEPGEDTNNMDLAAAIHSVTLSRVASGVAEWLLSAARNYTNMFGDRSDLDARVEKVNNEISKRIREDLEEEKSLSERYKAWEDITNDVLKEVPLLQNRRMPKVVIDSRVIQAQTLKAREQNRQLFEGRSLTQGQEVQLVAAPDINTLVSYGMPYLKQYTLPQYADSTEPVAQRARALWDKFKSHKGEEALNKVEAGDEIFFVADKTTLSEEDPTPDIWMVKEDKNGDITIGDTKYQVVGLLSKELGSQEGSTQNGKYYHAQYEEIAKLVDNSDEKYSLIKKGEDALHAPIGEVYAQRNTSLQKDGKDVTRGIIETLRSQGITGGVKDIIRAVINNLTRGTWEIASYYGGTVKMLTFNGRTLGVKEVDELTNRQGEHLTPETNLYTFNKTFARAIDELYGELSKHLDPGTYSFNDVSVGTLLQKLNNSLYLSEYADLNFSLAEDKSAITVFLNASEIASIRANKDTLKRDIGNFIKSLIFDSDGNFRKVGDFYVVHPQVSYTTICQNVQDANIIAAKKAELTRVLEDDLLNTTSLFLLPQVGGFTLNLENTNVPRLTEANAPLASQEIVDTERTFGQTTTSTPLTPVIMSERGREKKTQAAEALAKTTQDTLDREKRAKEVGTKDYARASHLGKDKPAPSPALRAGSFVGNLFDTLYRWATGQPLNKTVISTEEVPGMEDYASDAEKIGLKGNPFTTLQEELQKVDADTSIAESDRHAHKNNIITNFLSKVITAMSDSYKAAGEKVSMPPSLKMDWEAFREQFVFMLNRFTPTGTEISGGLTPIILNQDIAFQHKMKVIRDGRNYGTLDYVGHLDMLAFDANGDAYIIDFKTFKVGNKAEDLTAENAQKALSYSTEWESGRLDDWILQTNRYQRGIQEVLKDLGIAVKGTFVFPVMTAYDLKPGQNFPLNAHAKILTDNVEVTLKDGSTVNFGYQTNLLNRSQNMDGVDQIDFDTLSDEEKQAVKTNEQQVTQAPDSRVEGIGGLVEGERGGRRRSRNRSSSETTSSQQSTNQAPQITVVGNDNSIIIGSDNSRNRRDTNIESIIRKRTDLSTEQQDRLIEKTRKLVEGKVLTQAELDQIRHCLGI